MSALVVHGGLLLAYAAVVAGAFIDQSNDWPHKGNWSSLVFVFLCPGIVFQAVNLVFQWRTRRPLTRRALVRIATIPVGLILAGAMTSWASTRALASFRRAYAPFVAEVEAHLADPCPAAARSFAMPAVAAYNRQAGREWPAGKLRYGKKRFALSFGGGSLDVDGSTIFYDSDAKAWAQFHNDNAQAAAAYGRLVDGLAECPLRSEPR